VTYTNEHNAIKLRSLASINPRTNLHIAIIQCMVQTPTSLMTVLINIFRSFCQFLQAK